MKGGVRVAACKSRYPAICSRNMSSTSADQTFARRIPTGDALDSRGGAPTTPHAKSVVAALLAPGVPPPCRPDDVGLRGSWEPGSMEPAGSDAAMAPMLLKAMPLMPCICRSSNGDEVSERIVAAPSRPPGPLEGLNLPLSLRSGSGPDPNPAFGSSGRFSAGPRRRPSCDGGLRRSPSWRRGFADWGGGAPEPLLLLLLLLSLSSTMRWSARRPNCARSLALSSMALCGSNEMSDVARVLPPPKAVRRIACGPPASASATPFGSFGGAPIVPHADDMRLERCRLRLQKMKNYFRG